MALLLGMKFGRYTLDAHLGSGGLADVYAALDDVSGERVAIKVLHAGGPEAIGRLLREADVQARLRHPNVVALRDTVQVQGTPALVLELVEGPSLEAWLGDRPCPPKWLETVTVGLLAGLAAAHALGFVHRDVKPANVLLETRAGVVPKLADFGLVGAPDAAPQLTWTGAAMGTIGYMAPEQLEDASRVDARADVFAAGVTLYRCLTGRLPFPERDPVDYLQSIREGRFAPLRSGHPRRDELIARCLSADPERRPQDAAALLEAWGADAASLPRPSREEPFDVAASLQARAHGATWTERRVVLALEAAPAGLPEGVVARRGVWLPSAPGGLALLRSEDDARALLAELPSARGGVCVGEVTFTEHGPTLVARGAPRLEVSGALVDLARRLAALARPGTVLGSGVSGTPAGDWQVGDAVVALVLMTGADLPGDTADAWQIQRQGDLWSPVRPPPHNLPRDRDSFFGRTTELAQLAALLREGRGPITVLGAGGSGKTRLVGRFAWSQLGAHPGGAWLCDLAEARSASGIVLAVARALGVVLLAADPVEQLGNALRSRGRSLVILDNFEQVAEHAAATLGRWVGLAPEAAFLVTSRVRLELPGERALLLDALPVATDAAALFVARSQQAGSALTLDDDTRPDVEAIVGTLDGLPLAIELAAARALPLRELRRQLADRFSLLSSTAPERRQSTMRGTLDWSWDLLADWEKSALAQCSAFAGGFTVESAEEVIDLGAFEDAPWAVDAVQSLVDKSLLRTWSVEGLGERSDLAEPFFGMYVSVREYVEDKLNTPSSFPGSGAEARAATWRRHGAHFAGLGTPEALAGLVGPDAIRRRRALRVELDNLLVAARRGLEDADAARVTQCVLAACQVLASSGPYATGIELARGAAALDGVPLVDLARLHVAESSLHALLGDYDASQAAADRALAEAEAAGDRPMAVRAQRLQIDMHMRRGRYEDLVVQGLRVLEEARQLDLTESRVGLGSSIGIAQAQRGEVHAAEASLLAALAAAEEARDANLVGRVKSALNYLCTGLGRIDDAMRYGLDALAVARELDDASFISLALERVARAHRMKGEPEEAMRLTQEALTLDRSMGNRHRESFSMTQATILLMDMGRLHESLALRHQTLALHRELGNQMFVAILTVGLATTLFDLGQVEEGEARAREALALNEAAGNRHGATEIVGWLANMVAQRGRLDEARALYHRTIAAQQEMKTVRYEAMFKLNLGGLEVRLGDPAVARRLFDDGAALLAPVGDRRLDSFVSQALAQIDQLEGRWDEAERRLLASLQDARASENREQVMAVLGTLGRIASDEGRLDRATELLQEARALSETSPRPADVAATQVNAGLHEARLGRADESRRLLDAAIASARAHGLTLLLFEALVDRSDAELLLGGEASPWLEEAGSLAASMGLQPDSLWGRRLDEVSRRTRGPAHPPAG